MRLTWIILATLILIPGNMNAKMDFKLYVFEAGIPEPIDGALITLEGSQRPLGVTYDDGRFGSAIFSDTICGRKFHITCEGYKSSWFYFPWLKEREDIFTVHRDTIYLEREFHVLGISDNPWSKKNAKLFKPKVQTEVSIMLWQNSKGRSQFSVFFWDSTMTHALEVPKSETGTYSTNVLSRKLYYSWWIIKKQGVEIKRIALQDVVIFDCYHLVIPPDPPIKPGDWQPYHYPPPAPVNPDDIEPDPNAWMDWTEQPGILGAEDVIIYSLQQNCPDFKIKRPEIWVMFFKLNRLGEFIFLQNHFPPKDTVAWAMVEAAFQNLPKFKPFVYQAKPTNFFGYFILDTRKLE